eukprot:m.198162 g.198162  ORF g.198162 m.198162 type:complete len:575 (+) comp20371_c0_seq1:135-1859(+)
MAKRLLNVNIGVLGHVDSGKTSLSRALSTTASTNAFDKNPQSKERGITLDLGFSSCEHPLPKHLEGLPYDALQFTLVDCPGHASLIRTIIGGAQIIDQMILVIDITKGIQTQTAECLVIGEITTKKLVVVLNKADLLKPEVKEKHIAKTIKGLTKVFAKTKFPTPEMVVVSARPGGPESKSAPQGLDTLVDILLAKTEVPKRDVDGPLLFAVDHCFSIKGQGTVLTGTVLRGTVSVGNEIELPAQGMTRKVKSMQMFRRPVDRASMGDRLGMCVTSLDAKSIERGVVCAPGSLPAMTAAVAQAEKIRFFKSAVKTKSKFHVSVGHATVMCSVTFFGSDEGDGRIDVGQDYHYLDELALPLGGGDGGSGGGGGTDGKEVAAGGVMPERYRHQFVLLEFDTAVNCSPDALVIGSRLDADVHTPHCRLAFSGTLQMHTTEADTTAFRQQLRVYKPKVRTGAVDRMMDDYTVIGRTLFTKETALDKFLGLKVRLSTGESGIIDSGFGKSGKFKVRIPDGLGAEAKAALKGRGKKGKGKGGGDADGGEEDSMADGAATVSIILEFKRYVFDPEKALRQA